MAETTEIEDETEDIDESANEPYQDAVLRIKTTVTVTLAEKKETLRTILGLVPGSMLTFETHCDKPLAMRVGGHSIATGETVKIGDKFGLRVRTIGVESED